MGQAGAPTGRRRGPAAGRAGGLLFGGVLGGLGLLVLGGVGLGGRGLGGRGLLGLDLHRCPAKKTTQIRPRGKMFCTVCSANPNSRDVSAVVPASARAAAWASAGCLQGPQARRAASWRFSQAGKETARARSSIATVCGDALSTNASQPAMLPACAAAASTLLRAAHTRAGGTLTAG